MRATEYSQRRSENTGESCDHNAQPFDHPRCGREDNERATEDIPRPTYIIADAGENIPQPTYIIADARENIPRWIYINAEVRKNIPWPSYINAWATKDMS